MDASTSSGGPALSREMVGIEYSYIAKELDRLLVGKRLQKFQKIRESIYRMRFEKYDVLCELGRRMHITQYLEESEEADSFVQKAKKELVGKRLLAVRQLNRDRIVQFLFDDRSIVFELFKKGNILVLSGNRIVAVLYEEKWSGRELKPGVDYVVPPAPPKTLEDVLDDKPVIISLIRLSFGKQYGKELLARAGISENALGHSLGKDLVDRLKNEMDFVPEPQLFVSDGQVVDFGLTAFVAYKNTTVEKVRTLNEAADRFYWENRQEGESAEFKKLKTRLEKQKEYLSQLNKEEKYFRAVAEWFYSNYAYVDSLIDEARKLGVRNLERLKEKYREIKEINKEKKTIDIEVQ